jgi:hypothetical protein
MATTIPRKGKIIVFLLRTCDQGLLTLLGWITAPARFYLAGAVRLSEAEAGEYSDENIRFRVTD